MYKKELLPLFNRFKELTNEIVDKNYVQTGKHQLSVVFPDISKSFTSSFALSKICTFEEKAFLKSLVLDFRQPVLDIENFQLMIISENVMLHVDSRSVQFNTILNISEEPYLITTPTKEIAAPSIYALDTYRPHGAKVEKEILLLAYRTTSKPDFSILNYE